MKKTLIVIDMQNDFISGTLGSVEAEKIVDNVAKKVDEYEKNGLPIIYTRDTHFEDYFNTLEGKKLPIKHCVKNTQGWQVNEKVDRKNCLHIDKYTFGYTDWDTFDFEEVEMCGLCTDICVVSNALLLRAMFKDMKITVDASCCAGSSVKAHNDTLTVMRSCQIDVINDCFLI